MSWKLPGRDRRVFSASVSSPSQGTFLIPWLLTCCFGFKVSPELVMYMS